MSRGTGLRVDVDGGGSRLGLRVRPGGAADRITGVYGDRLKVEVSAPPDRGKANEAVRRLIADALGVARGDVVLVSGASSRDKVVRVEGLSPARVRRLLTPSGGPGAPAG